MSHLQSESFVFDARPEYPLLIPVKRYWSPEFTSQDGDAVTLILAHATSFHNESWEPVLEDLFDVMATVSSLAGRVPKIQDVWAIGCPNHGDGGILNEQILEEGYAPTFSWGEYGRCIHHVLVGNGKGIDVEFSKRRLVGIGHSSGAIGIMLASTFYPKLHWCTAILLEPMLIDSSHDKHVTSILNDGAPKRRDVWPDRETARKQFLNRSFKSWDPRMVELYVRYGLRDLPSVLYPDTTGVTLKCTKRSELATYAENTGRITGQRYLSAFCSHTPTHALFGAIGDVIPKSNREYVVNNLAQGKLKSASAVENAGHLIVQQNPGGVAEKLCEILLSKDVVRGKL